MKTLIKPPVVIPACPESFLLITLYNFSWRRIPAIPNKWGQALFHSREWQIHWVYTQSLLSVCS